MSDPLPSVAPPARPVWLRFVPPILAFGLVAGLGWLLLKPSETVKEGGTLIGQSAPDFNLGRLDGGDKVQLSSFKGQPVILNFWASWCGPCKAEAPLFHELSLNQQNKHYQILGILFQEPKPQSAIAFAKEHGLAYPNLEDPTIETGIQYGITGIPATIFIDSAGVVQHVDRGGLDRARLNIGLEKIGVPPL